MNKNARCVGKRTLPRAASRATEIGYAAMNTITMKNLTICDASYVATWCNMVRHVVRRAKWYDTSLP